MRSAPREFARAALPCKRTHAHAVWVVLVTELGEPVCTDVTAASRTRPREETAASVGTRCEVVVRSVSRAVFDVTSAQWTFGPARIAATNASVRIVFVCVDPRAMNTRLFVASRWLPERTIGTRTNCGLERTECQRLGVVWLRAYVFTCVCEEVVTGRAFAISTRPVVAHAQKPREVVTTRKVAPIAAWALAPRQRLYGTVWLTADDAVDYRTLQLGTPTRGAVATIGAEARRPGE